MLVFFIPILFISIACNTTVIWLERLHCNLCAKGESLKEDVVSNYQCTIIFYISGSLL